MKQRIHLTLDQHDIAQLKQDGVPSTDDSMKYTMNLGKTYRFQEIVTLLMGEMP